jgi:hypothetical protein
MAAALNVLGVVAGTVSLFPFLSELISPNDSKDDTTVRVVLGSSVNESDSFSGNTPGASLWDFIGNPIGFTDGTSHILPQGNFVDISISPRTSAGNIQAQYISISNGGIDAVCIAGLSVTFPDGAVAGFSTNVAASCGAFWSNSNTPILGQAASGENDKPKCVWIDRNGSNGIPHQGFGIHLPSFSSTNANLGKAMTDDSRLMCKSGPRFRMYPQLKTEDSVLVFQHPPEFITDPKDGVVGTDKDPGFIIENPGIPAGSLTRFSAQKREAGEPEDDGFNIASAEPPGTSALDSNGPQQNPLAERLIISPHSYNSARELCKSWNSFGHSFVSLDENLFCDMTDKTLYYVCSENQTTCCLDTDKATFRGCQEDSITPGAATSQGSLTRSARFRGRQVEGFGTSWMKGDRGYESVQRW